MKQSYFVMDDIVNAVTKCYTGPQNWTDSLQLPGQWKPKGKRTLEIARRRWEYILE
jgi:hypothetical protein